jgi:hypothetical protein
MVDWATWATFGLKNNKEIGHFLASLRKRVFGKKLQIAVTGMEGVGKTVLMHALTGEDRKPTYKKPTRSQNKETRKIKTAGQKLLLVSVPGQPADPRYATLDDLFRGAKPVDGVIHVVGAGLAIIREPDAKRSLIEDSGIDTIEKFRKYQRDRERTDLEETCRAIRDSHRKHHAPKWLVLAVDKIDLYWDKVDDTVQTYSPRSKSGLPKLLQELIRQVGEDNFRWRVLPVCGLLEDFEWNGQTLRSQINEEKRQLALAHFLTELAAYGQ